MKNLLFILLLLPFIGFSQARLVLNNGGYINIENNAYLVIDNGNANAITLTGSGGNILSENERDVVKWNVGTATGNHSVPFTNTSGVKIPVEVNITTAGNAGGSLLFSTYRTNSMNTQWPTVPPAVTNMCSMLMATDASLFVMDRFWRIDGNSYATKPAATLSFGYDYANEAAGPNTIGEASMQAQRFNPGIGIGGIPSCHGTIVTGNWENLLFGAANVATKKVENVAISSTDFFKDWILVDNSMPLPVTLLNFDATCEKGYAIINWATASENNNDYFVLEKSTDGFNFSAIATIQGSGNSNEVIKYTHKDNTPNIATSYYRLKQVDYSGRVEYFNIISSNCSAEEDFLVSDVKFTDNALQFNVATTTQENLTIALYDYSGKLIANQTTLVNKGSNQIKFDGLNVSKGIYMLNLMGQENHFATKLFRQ